MRPDVVYLQPILFPLLEGLAKLGLTGRAETLVKAENRKMAGKAQRATAKPTQIMLAVEVVLLELVGLGEGGLVFFRCDVGLELRRHVGCGSHDIKNM
jgi:hypothetical protein